MKTHVFHLKRYLSTAGPGRAIVQMPKAQQLLTQGTQGTAVFYILAGLVKLTVVAHGKDRTMAIIGPETFTGKDCLATAWPRRTASATTLTNCTVLRIERNEMLRVIQHEETFAAFFLDYLLTRITRYQDIVTDQLLNSAEQRLVRALLLLAKMGHGDTADAVIPNISQEELAEVVGTTRARVNTFMNRFRNTGLIAYTYHGPVTIRIAALSKLIAAR
ncbi:MAG TPA: Crp/Fnr family transcriptional regulator [Chloroflexota bacterium]|nr:Crp/Fnr family transcriptional regulator [Chloroflexota bacterium]